jgi:phosphatidylglycerol:prolipoprotein diacylglycerol transferase
MTMTGVITIGLDPDIHLGPVMFTWMGLTIGIAIVIGTLLAARGLHERRLVQDPLYTLVGLVAIGAVVGSRLYYVVEHGGPLIGRYGYTYFGGMILSGLLLFAYIWRKRLSVGYLDAIAAALPFSVAIGRVGDIVNGEHYGAASNFLLAVRNANPNAMTPNPSIAYQNIGLYEAMLGALIFLIVWPLRRRLTRPLDLTWMVLVLFAVGRFPLFFFRTVTPRPALGLADGQWTSIALVIVAVLGWLLTRRYGKQLLAWRGGVLRTRSVKPLTGPETSESRSRNQ